VSAFAVREGLDVQRLYWWRRRLVDAPLPAQLETPGHCDGQPAFVEIVRPEAAVIEVVLGSGRTLRVRESIDPCALRRLVIALDEGTC
jgi:hypothetical protein